MTTNELDKKLTSLLQGYAGSDVLDVAKKIGGLGETVALAVTASKGKGSSTLFAIIKVSDDESGGQILVRLAESSARAAAKGKNTGWATPEVLHQDTVVFPLPMAAKPEDEVPEDIAQKLAIQCAKSLTSRKLSDDEAEVQGRLLRSGGVGLPITRGFFSFIKDLFTEADPSAGGESQGGAPPHSERNLNELLLHTAKAQVNILSSKEGPDGGNLACVWAVNKIFKLAFGRTLTTALGTSVIDSELRGGKGRAVTEGDAQPGCIIISPTGTGQGHGHIGILGENGLIYSNSSSRARWEQNHTLASWKARYVTTKGMDLNLYQLLPAVAGTGHRRLRPESAGDLGAEGSRSTQHPSPTTVTHSEDAGKIAASLPPISDHSARTLDNIRKYWEAKSARQRNRSARFLGFGEDKIRLLAEGDSWFDFKIIDDVIDVLADDYDYDIENVAAAGACVYEMSYGPDDDQFIDMFNRDPSQLAEVVRLIGKHRPHALLLSGAGNDFAGPEFIMLIHHAMAKKSGLNEKVLRGLFEDEIEPAYRLVVETCTQAAQDAGLGPLPILVHGYDYAFPDGRKAVNIPFGLYSIGPWMHDSFLKKGYPFDDGNDELRVRRDLVKKLIDALYEMHARIASDWKNVHIVNVRNTLPDRLEDWHDELHPSRSGFKKVAAKFQEVLLQVLPSAPAARARSTSRGLSLADEAGESENAPAVSASPESAPAIAPDDDPQDSGSLFTRARLAQARERILDLLALGFPQLALEVYETLDQSLLAGRELSLALPARFAAEQEGLWQALATRIHAELQPTRVLSEEPIGNDVRFRRATGGQRSVPTLEQRRAEYDNLFTTCRIRPEKADTVAWYKQRIEKGKARYQALGNELSIPWRFIAITHALEASCDFTRHLHNGDPLSARTSRVPSGRPPGGSPPFSFEDSARDAMMMKNFHLQDDWSEAAMIYRFEQYNGWGYFNRGVANPYLWSFSQHYEKGKFTSDHVFNENAVSKQAGAAVLLKAIS